MHDATNPFDSSVILDGIRRWVEIETPTEVPAQVNKLADLVASGYRDLPVTVERIAGKDGCGDHLVARSSWGQDAPGILRWVSSSGCRSRSKATSPSDPASMT